jgi:hypothetical protein
MPNFTIARPIAPAGNESLTAWRDDDNTPLSVSRSKGTTGYASLRTYSHKFAVHVFHFGFSINLYPPEPVCGRIERCHAACSSNVLK